MEKPLRLVVIDGSNFFWRAFHGGSDHQLNYSGHPTWAIHGTIMSIAFTAKLFNPSHLLVVFDWGQSEYRTKIYQAYKANRPSGLDDNTAKNQMTQLRDILDLFNVPVYREHGVEADDVVAKVCELYSNELPISLITGDKDWRQLVSKNVEVVHPSLGEKEQDTWTFTRVFEHYGLEPRRLHEVWALSGDKTDNIPGLRGVGEKRALKLIQNYGSLDSLLLNSQEEKIQNNKEIIKLSDKLVSLHPNLCNFNLNLNQLEFKPISLLQDQEHKLEGILQDYGLKRIESKWREGTLWFNRGKRLNQIMPK